MKNFPLVLILSVSIIFIVGINVRYLGHLGTHLDLQKVNVDDAPNRQVDDDNNKLPGKEKNRQPPKLETPLTKQNFASSQSKLESSSSGTTGHRVAGLQCDRYGGPSEEIVAEMIYWRDIPSDADFVSPYAKYGPTPKYLTFEPDEGGWNNIRMSMETATVLAHAMGRILVLPPEQNMYLLWNDKKKRKNKFTFKDFFHFDSIAEEHPAVQVISMEEFIQREGLTGHLKDKNSGEVTFPPGNHTTWNGHGRAGKEYWHWLRNATEAPKWAFDDCVVAFGKEAGPEGAKAMKEYRKDMPKKKWITHQYVDNPTPVDAPPKDRMNEVLGDRRELCVYGDHFQNVPVMHFMGDNASGARLLVHFYAFLYFEDWHQDLWTKRFVRDHLRYIDEIQCAAARIVHAVREKARENGDPSGTFDTFHIRRGDFQYKETRVDADEIYENVRDVLVENSTIFIATDEKNMAFFDPLREHYHLYFLNDFMPLITDLNKNYYGMLDQRIASRGRTFVGAYFSTFTGYINRMRGYHSQKDKLAGYEKGELNSYYYTPKRNKHAMRAYRSVKAPMWSREFPIGWRDIDHDVAKDGFTPLSG
jgi:hypothetical protein